MAEEEPLDRAVEDDDFDVLVGLQGRDHGLQRPHVRRAEDGQGLDIEGDAPIGRGTALETDLLVELAIIHRGASDCGCAGSIPATPSWRSIGDASIAPTYRRY